METSRGSESELQRGTSDSDLARRNTAARVFYVAVCAKCGDQPDGDGEEYQITEAAAFSWPIDNPDADWWLDDSERLLCVGCRPNESWRS